MNKNEIPLKTIQRKLFLLGIFKIPMIGFVRPRLIYLDDQKVSLKIRLRRRTKNHLNSMYFGALAVGADIASGIHAFYLSEQLGRKVSIAFKNFEGEFIKRAESDVIFDSDQGDLVKKAIMTSLETGERINQQITVYAFNTDAEEVARFSLTLSVKVK